MFSFDSHVAVAPKILKKFSNARKCHGLSTSSIDNLTWCKNIFFLFYFLVTRTLTIILAIYNLSKKSQGLSHHGYFHWRTHIMHFIEKNWSMLMDPAMYVLTPPMHRFHSNCFINFTLNSKRRKNWIGTISGALSHNSPTLFTSGLSLFQEAGWWKLTHNKSPKQYYEMSKKVSRTADLPRNLFSDLKIFSKKNASREGHQRRS